MPNDGTVKIGVELDSSNVKKSLESISSAAKKGFSKISVEEKVARQALESSSKEIEKLSKKLKEMGSVDTLTDAQKADYEETLKSLSEMYKKAESAKNKLDDLNDLKFNKLKESLDSAAKNLSEAGNKLTVGVTVPLTAAGAAAVKYASDTEEAMNKVQVAFGDSADEIIKWSKTTLESYGMAQGTALDMAALFGDMATSMGFSQAAAADMSKQLVGLAGDIASFKNIGVDEAMTALAGVFTGETESLKRLGIVMTQANVEAWALTQGIEANYEKMSQAEKVALQYQYVLAMTTNAQGDFARTSDSTANQLRILQESIKQLAASFGQTLLPIVTPIIENLNQMVQNFADLDEETKKAVVQFALFAATLGPMLKLTGGITQAVQTGISVYQSLKTALTAATAAQVGLNTAMAANPVGLLVTAIGGLVAVMGAFGISAALTAEHVETLSGEIATAKQEYAELTGEIEKSGANTMEQVAALQNLVEQENKTAAQKESIKKLVDDLNESVPELSLAYDEQTDSLNMTTEAIKAAAEAELERAKQQAAIDRLTEAYQEQIKIAEELEKAQAELERQEQRYAEAAENSTAKTSRQKDQMYAYEGALIGAQGEVDRLTELQNQNEAEIAELEAAYGHYAGVTLEEARKASIELVNQSGRETVAINATTAAIKAKLQALLAAAQAESKGSAAAIAQGGFDPITVALNTAKYTKSQAEVKAYTDALSALEKAEADAANTANDLNKAVYSGSGGTGSSSTSKAVTQAEKNLEAYKEAVKQLDHQRAMDLISEEEYYQRKNELGLKYLKEGSDEQMALEEELYEWEKQQQEEALKAKTEAYESQRDALKKAYEKQEITTEEYLSELNRIQSEYLDEGTEDWVEAVEFRNSEIERLNEEFYDAFTESLDSIGDRYSDAISDIESAQQSLADKLANTGELFETVDDRMQLTDLQDSIDQIKEYGDALNQLRERGVSESLMGEILAMDTEEATSYMGKLLQMTDEDFAEYNALWEEKQQLARDIAEQFYADQMDVLETEFTDELAGALSEVPETMETIGRDAVQAWIKGFQAEQGAAIDAVTAFQDALNMASGAVGTANAAMAPAASSAPQNATESAITQAAGMMAMSQTSGADRPIVIEMNGREVARGIIPNIRAVEKQTPEIKFN